jgi:hypothetical protein
MDKINGSPWVQEEARHHLLSSQTALPHLTGNLANIRNIICSVSTVAAINVSFLILEN